MQHVTNFFVAFNGNWFIGPDSSWFWGMIQALVIVASLLFICKQIRYQRYGNLLTTLVALDAKWRSKEMIAARQYICENYESKDATISSPEDFVLNFFEEIGLYLKHNVISASLVWDLYSYYIENYWAILSPRITKFHADTDDKTWYENFQELQLKMRKESNKRKVTRKDITEIDIKKFIDGEMSMKNP